MTTLQQFFLRHTSIFLLAIAALCGLTPSLAHAQDTYNGPFVDVCSSNGFPFTGPDGNTDITESGCVYGDVSGLNAWVEVEDDDYTLEEESGPDTPYTGAEVQFYSANGTLVYDSGLQGGGESSSASGSTIPTPNEWYSVGLSSCYWGQCDNLGSSVEVTGVTGTQGIVYPKYVVVGVTYAPPSIASYVQYGGITSVGSTSTYSSSFGSGYSIGVSSQYGYGIPAGKTIADASVAITTSLDLSLTQTQNTSTSNTTSKSTSVLYKTAGYPTTNPSNGPLSPTLPDDYDTIEVWLNPEVILTATPPSGSNPATIQWNGYAFDPEDQDYPDVADIPVGCLNGDFLTGAFEAANPTYCDQAQSDLNRAWVYTNEPYALQSPTTGTAVTAPGCAPQTAESPSICPNTQDAYNILASDPLAYIPGVSAYTGFNSQPLPSTTPDGRFTQITGPNDPNPVQFQPGQSETFGVTQMNTQVQSNGGQTQAQEKFTVSAVVSTGFLNIFNSKTTYTNTDTFTQTNTWLNSLTTTQTVSDAFQIQASNPPNYLNGGAAPGEFTAYQDNEYGTFVLIAN